MTADSPVDLIIARRYRCSVDPLHDNSQRDGVGVYPATTIRVPKPLMVKLSADDSMLQEFAVLRHLHTGHPKATQFIANIEDFVEAKAASTVTQYSWKKAISTSAPAYDLHRRPRAEQDSIAWTLLSVCSFISSVGLCGAISNRESSSIQGAESHAIL